MSPTPAHPDHTHLPGEAHALLLARQWRLRQVMHEQQLPVLPVLLIRDAIGCQGYAVDYSRTFGCGAGRPSAGQPQWYALAHAQLEHKAALLRCGRSFEEIAAKAWAILITEAGPSLMSGFELGARLESAGLG